jgi:hypothetical protein
MLLILLDRRFSHLIEIICEIFLQHANSAWKRKHDHELQENHNNHECSQQTTNEANSRNKIYNYRKYHSSEFHLNDQTEGNCARIAVE